MCFRSFRQLSPQTWANEAVPRYRSPLPPGLVRTDCGPRCGIPGISILGPRHLPARLRRPRRLSPTPAGAGPGGTSGGPERIVAAAAINIWLQYARAPLQPKASMQGVRQLQRGKSPRFRDRKRNPKYRPMFLCKVSANRSTMCLDNLVANREAETDGGRLSVRRKCSKTPISDLRPQPGSVVRNLDHHAARVVPGSDFDCSVPIASHDCFGCVG